MNANVASMQFASVHSLFRSRGRGSSCYVDLGGFTIIPQWFQNIVGWVSPFLVCPCVSLWINDVRNNPKANWCGIKMHFNTKDLYSLPDQIRCRITNHFDRIPFHWSLVLLSPKSATVNQMWIPLVVPSVILSSASHGLVNIWNRPVNRWNEI